MGSQAMFEAGPYETAEVTRSPLLDGWFELSERDTTLRTELVAGLTTLMTMDCIISAAFIINFWLLSR
jgi:hypothetical protein